MKLSYITMVVVAIIILTCAIIGVSVLTQGLLARDSAKLEQSISAIERGTISKDWNQAKAGQKEVADTWSKVKGTWSALIDHQEIDNIDVTLTRLEMLIQAEEMPSALSEAAALKKYIGHIPAKEKLNLENLF